MVIVRPVSMDDLDALAELAGLAGVGLTTLPKDRALLAKRIAASESSFGKFADKPGGESYLFVMEDRGDGPRGRVVGACGIVSKVGGFQPFYGYRIESQLFESKIIGVHKEVPLLKLHEEHDGPCEIGSLFLHPDWRKEGNGRLLQLVRFLFIAEHPEMFEPNVISEIRGVLNERGHSPFWDAIGRHFFGLDFAEADRLSVVNKKFIAELMPDHPIYIPLLPADAQAVIGKPHRDSERAVKNLEAEGFRFANMVDIFDAGPVVSCPRDEIRTVRESRRMTIAAISDERIEAAEYMIGTTTETFRACKGPVDRSNRDGVRITSDAAAALQLNVGDPVRIVELSPPPALETPKAV
ncbi:MAG: arginine N-succinyltransferase [Phycisphaerales bacterium]|jgi:arginine N-succinyltransferase|nr:arginine N-succinyltransferase [Phycisphaerales bacterium]